MAARGLATASPGEPGTRLSSFPAEERGGRSAAARAGDSTRTGKLAGTRRPSATGSRTRRIGHGRSSAGHKSARGGPRLRRRGTGRATTPALLDLPGRGAGIPIAVPGAGEPRTVRGRGGTVGREPQAEPLSRRGGPVAAAGDQRGREASKGPIKGDADL